MELTVADPKKLPFVANLSAGAMLLGTELIKDLVEVAQEKPLNVLRRRKIMRQLKALTSLTEQQLLQWQKAFQLQQQHDVEDDHQRNGPDATLRARLEFIMDTLLKNELAAPFAAPVDGRLVQGYFDIIKQPMDLGTIKSRLSRGYYDQRPELVVQDVNLVWTNCFTFNRVDSEISRSANRLRSIFSRLFEHWISEQAANTPVSALPSEEQCRRCAQTHASDRMLLCDSCDAAYHLFCLEPPLEEIPAGNWYCPRCPIQRVSM
ncbi:hypothetical protein ATCC90586_007278 [Pythium insidiosum]|nr:hypothetical protein ATCC90586_007278 [Pythium insidiosum]